MPCTFTTCDIGPPKTVFMVLDPRIELREQRGVNPASHLIARGDCDVGHGPE
jgi:hypothetical protein